jgi:alpha-glucosidase (family GH31 glycosyl hydrolase)
MQYGLWSPIFRPHCDKSIFLTPEPWRFNDETREVINRSLRFRHRLVPYLYTTNVRVATQGTSLCEPMYYDHPEVNEAYEYKNQYTFGSELIVAPITTPRVQETTYGKTTAWLPPGRFVDIFTNMVYDGNRDVVFHRPLDKCPVLAKEGAIIPLDGAEIPGNGCLTPTSLEILLVVGADGQFELVEDAGVGASIRDIEFSRTPIKYTHSTGTLTIGPTSNPLVPMRKWSVRLLAYTPSAEIRGTRDSQSLKPRSESTPTGTLVEVGTVPGFESIKLELGTAEPQLDKTGTQDAIFKVLDDGQMSTRKKDVIWNIVQEFGQVPVQIIMSRLAAVGGVGDEVKEAIMECLLADSR